VFTKVRIPGENEIDLAEEIVGGASVDWTDSSVVAA
jgi:hypothetical protein